MPSFQDSAVIFFIALLLFGPKKLPELARYIGKLMNEFRRASNEFRMQMDDEFRQIEQAENQKKIAAIEAAAPVAPALDMSEPHASTAEHRITPHVEIDPDQAAEFDPAHAEYPPEQVPGAPSQTASPFEVGSTEPTPTPDPLPIATSGELSLMPPATGLPVSRSSSLGGVFDSIPLAPDPATHHESETTTHG